MLEGSRLPLMAAIQPIFLGFQTVGLKSQLLTLWSHKTASMWWSRVCMNISQVIVPTKQRDLMLNRRTYVGF